MNKLRKLFCFSALLSVIILSGCATSKLQSCPPGTQALLNPINDPLEGYNRSIQAFNSGVSRHVLRPFSLAYQFIVPEFVQTGFHNFGQNLLFPQHAVNSLLQSKYEDAWIATKRFGINSTVGILGLRDQAKAWGIPAREEDFAQTLATYHVPSGCFFNLPLIGPSNLRDTVGMIVDLPFSLDYWLFPQKANFIYSGAQAFNEYAPKAGTLQRFFAVNYDSYLLTKAFYTLEREAVNRDYTLPEIPGDPDQSLGALLLKPHSEEIYQKAKHRSILLPGGKSKLPYVCWPAENSKGIMIILPGLGAHRLSDDVTALAEMLLRDGWSVLAVSSTFHPDYFLHLPEIAPAGYFQEDVKVLAQVIQYAVADMTKKFQLKAQPCSILGFSLGAINALFLSQYEAEGGLNDFAIQRYTVLNPPVDMFRALSAIDQFFAIPATWQEADREERCHDLYLRLATVLANQDSDFSPAALPITREESQFLIGLSMRLNLAATLIAGQSTLNQGLFENDPAQFNKNAVWAEALSISFADYMEKSVLPWYQRRNPDLSRETMLRQCHLASLEASLRKNDKIRLFQNENDFLINDKDLQWYRNTFGERAILLPQGGHLGNVFLPEYQQMILNSLNQNP